MTSDETQSPDFSDEEIFQQPRQRMLDVLWQYGIRDPRVLQAMGRIRRHRFIPAAAAFLEDPYGDFPISIGFGQTISQPFIVAYMTERLNPQSGEKILEIGTGSGYQAAVLAELGARVFSLEVVSALAIHAQDVLKREGYSVQVRRQSGYDGWPEEAPFDIIIGTCAPETIPAAIVEQVKVGGRIMLPVGDFGHQRLVFLRKTAEGLETTEDLPVRFVPMVHLPAS